MPVKTFFKTFGISIAIYLLLNLVFMVLFVLVGGMQYGGTSVPFGEFWSIHVKDDIGGFIVALFIPGGNAVPADIFSAIMFYIEDMAVHGANALTWNIFGMLWVIVPGLVAAILAGKVFAREFVQTSFLAVLSAILFLTVLPILVALIGAIPAYHGLTQSLISPLYWTHDLLGEVIWWPPSTYLGILLTGAFNGFFFGSIAAFSASSM